MGRITFDACADIMICWNPGKTGISEGLKQARFSIRDTLVTRQQLAKTPVLTLAAAQCVVDFCPDMLWRDILLRVCSEAGYGNKQIRDRLCLNGNYCDKATITKRIGSTLGQKQQQSTAKRRQKQEDPDADPSQQKVKGYALGEASFYDQNVKDYEDYTDFFGLRKSHRNQLKLQPVGTKRKVEKVESEGEDGSSSAEEDKGSRKRPKLALDTTQSSDAVESSSSSAIQARGGGVGLVRMSGDESEESEESNEDAVSIQSDTILDEMDED